MHQKTTEVPLSGHTYQIRRMLPDVGSYIWQKLMAGCFKAQQANANDDAVAQDEVPAAQPPAADRLRILCGMAFMYLDFEAFAFVQNSCMKVTSRVEEAGPIPVMSYDGRWSVPDLEYNPFLVTKLMTEALVFNLSDFLSESEAPKTAVAASPVTAQSHSRR